MNKFQILLLGSSNRQLALFENNKIISVLKGACSLDDLQSLNLDKSLKTLIISVRPDLNFYYKEDKEIKIFSNEISIQKFRINNLYDGFGQDRLASLLGAVSFFPEDSIGVLDLGTCTTFSALEKKDKLYELTGGFICAGISPSLKALKQNTSSLPLVNDLEFINYCLSPPHSIQSPSEAICEGILQQIFALLNKLKNDYPNFKLILTGGWSNLFKSINFDLIEPNLPLIGGQLYLQS